MAVNCSTRAGLQHWSFNRQSCSSSSHSSSSSSSSSSSTNTNSPSVSCSFLIFITIYSLLNSSWQFICIFRLYITTVHLLIPLVWYISSSTHSTCTVQQFIYTFHLYNCQTAATDAYRDARLYSIEFVTSNLPSPLFHSLSDMDKVEAHLLLYMSVSIASHDCVNRVQTAKSVHPTLLKQLSQHFTINLPGGRDERYSSSNLCTKSG